MNSLWISWSRNISDTYYPLLGPNWTCVKAFNRDILHLQYGDSCFGFAIQDTALDRCSATIFWEQRWMYVQAEQWRNQLKS